MVNQLKSNSIWGIQKQNINIFLTDFFFQFGNVWKKIHYLVRTFDRKHMSPPQKTFMDSEPTKTEFYLENIKIKYYHVRVVTCPPLQIQKSLPVLKTTIFLTSVQKGMSEMVFF